MPGRWVRSATSSPPIAALRPIGLVRSSSSRSIRADTSAATGPQRSPPPSAYAGGAFGIGAVASGRPAMVTRPIIAWGVPHR